jgi:acyl-coenzyme A thioesterase PaaI-like protein
MGTLPCMEGIQTHQAIDPSLCGTPVAVANGTAEVVLVATDQMVVDELGLVHGGFVFGVADHAAMLAVNDPNVVLGSAEVRFVAPVCVGDELRAKATTLGKRNTRREVAVSVVRDEEEVLSGTFQCFVLDRHVLD